MRANIEKFVNIETGQTCSAGLNELGYFDDDETREGFKLRKLRVAPMQPYIEKLTALLTTPGGIVVGPIDIPFTYNVECPVTVVVTCPSRCANNQTVKMIVSDLPDSPNLYGATYFVQPQQGADVPIPDAVVAVTAYPSTAALTFKDGGGNVIAQALAYLIVARPRLAKTVASNAPIPSMLFHY